MQTARTLIAGLMLAGAALPAMAADFSDPTWPCIQRKVERLSPGLMWTYPLDAAFAPETDTLGREIADLAGTLALRRVELASAQPAVEAFAQRHGGDPELLGQVFVRVFESLAKRRSRIITGIGEFSLSQIALSEKIDAARAEMNALMAAADPDFDRVDTLEEQLDWDQVIYSDRQRSITYLCETPVLLERRLFGVAQMLLAVAKDEG